MATEILIPKIGMSMNEGELTEWLAEDGARIEEGQPLFSVESDKSSNEIESPASGTLRILMPAGSTYDVGVVIGRID